jgi:hypothetical protein
MNLRAICGRFYNDLLDRAADCLIAAFYSRAWRRYAAALLLFVLSALVLWRLA